MHFSRYYTILAVAFCGVTTSAQPTKSTTASFLPSKRFEDDFRPGINCVKEDFYEVELILDTEVTPETYASDVRQFQDQLDGGMAVYADLTMSGTSRTARDSAGTLLMKQLNTLRSSGT